MIRGEIVADLKTVQEIVDKAKENATTVEGTIKFLVDMELINVVEVQDMGWAAVPASQVVLT